MREPDSLIKSLMMGAYQFKDESKIGAEHLSKIWSIYYKHVKITLCVTGKGAQESITICWKEEILKK